MQLPLFKKFSLLTTVSLIIVLYALNQKPKKQIPIANETIDSITIEPNYNIDPTADAPRKLNTELVKKFVQDCKIAPQKSAYNYHWTYLLKVYQKDSTKTFWTNGGLLQLELDESYQLGEKDYFDKLWNDARQ